MTPREDIPPAEIAAGTKDEHAEHHQPLPIAKRTALDHLKKFPHYYSDLATAETTFRKSAVLACHPDGTIVHHACGDTHVSPGTTTVRCLADLGKAIGHDKAFHDPLVNRALVPHPPLPPGAVPISWQEARARLQSNDASGVRHAPTDMTFASEALERRKEAVFNDLAKHLNYVPGKDVMADRSASASFIGHEKKHVLGIHNPTDIAFPDAAAHAGIADMVFRSGGRDIRELLPPAYHHLIRGTTTYDTQGASGTLKNRAYDLPTGRLATGWDPRTNLVATAHMRNDGSGRRVMIPNALADVARDHLSRHYSNDAVRLLSGIKAPIDLPPPRGFKPLNRSK